ncbi:2-phosphosulfolactate phosphatase [Psychrobacillus sp. OK032]|uniref:2-phosphosulfolactate phosphatase n=1 Tax=Psychrobacillus sp. OK032 TaxID=1884358 RepID=UPI0008B92D55|nr:2-phosphosulfolactate phosphatase [Psychrobacillus sp. OK032]SER67767.1 2-phosphosulfolactate phosphatase [Psychrobacillus sp. OK032]
MKSKELIELRKVHVITQKEAVNELKLEGCTTVVIDVFLATSTIAFLLENQYEAVYAVKDSESALAVAANLPGPYVLMGETKGHSINGFIYPDPCLIEVANKNEVAIICSTNGTRAIEKAVNAKKLYISSIINGHVIAERIHDQEDDSSIVLICSGNDDRFSMEDFVGAGHIIDHLMQTGKYILSDSSKIARETYKSSMANGFQNLLESETAELLRSFHFPESMEYVIKHFEKVNVLPVLEGNKIVNERRKVRG